MGLLDDAIREHLELKRRGGVDPAVVERAELEALAPVYPHEDAALNDDARPSPAADAHLVRGDLVPAEGHHDADPRLADLGGVGQDTAELDMRTVLEEDAHATGAAHPVGPSGEAAVLAHGEGPSEESFECERRSASESRSVPEEIPGEERLSFE